MKHINLFSTQSEYDNAKLSYPNLSFIEETEKVIVSNKLLPKNNQIFYTSTDGNIVEPYKAINIGTLVSNTYEDGLGVMTFENEITSIGNHALVQRQMLRTVNIPSSVKNIDEGAFFACTSLTSVTFDEVSQLESIGNNAFMACYNLTNINYGGTSEKFTAIVKGNDWKTNVTSSCIVHCTDGDFPITQFA